MRLDVGPGGSAGEGGAMDGCTKIDFLFVIDNSGSMAAHQDNLRNNFGPFIDAVLDAVQAKDYHVMVVDSDAAPGSSSTSTGGNCSGFCGSCQPGAQCVCNGVTCGGECEHVLGGGKTGNGTCNIPDGERFLTDDMDAATIATTFECVASRIGVNGSGNELPLTAMAAAVTDLSAPGQCNEGFVRDDAILVVTVISDDHQGWAGDDDSTIVGTPQGWVDGLIAAKGKLESVAVLGLFAEQNLAPSDCLDGDNGAPFSNPKFLEFIDLLGPQGFLASVCEPNYLPAFMDALPLIDTTCDDFVPPG